MTDKFAVFGNPIAQSKSPEIHQQFAGQFNLQINYTRILSTEDQFARELAQFFSDGGVGCNVTAPFKELAFQQCATLTETAQRAKAVNTVILQADNSLLGHNSDGIGLVTDIVRNKQVPMRDKDILILGAGGATRGILAPIIAEQPKAITIANRTVEKARLLAAEFADLFPIKITATERPEYNSAPDILINGTSASLSAALPVTDDGLVDRHTVCYDLSYSAQPTAFLEWAASHGAKQTIDGKGMLAEQAADSFLHWTKQSPDTKAIIQWLEEQAGK